MRNETLCARCQVLGYADCCPSVKFNELEVTNALAISGKIFSECFRWTNDGIYSNTQGRPGVADPDGTPLLVSTCIFLGVDNRCSIYDVAPGICKDFSCE